MTYSPLYDGYSTTYGAYGLSWWDLVPYIIPLIVMFFYSAAPFYLLIALHDLKDRIKVLEMQVKGAEE